MTAYYDRREFLQQITRYGLGLCLSSGGIDWFAKDNAFAETKASIIGDHRYRKTILLGIDGLDPKVLSQLMKRGEVPNFTRLGKEGDFLSMATSNPAQSPVAWSTIATGHNSGYHGIYDFLNRRVTDYMPETAILKNNPGNIFGKRESFYLPAMQGDTFWDNVASKGIPSTVIRWPMTFQPKQSKARLYAGLGVPDLRGGLGKYSFYTTKKISADSEGSEKVIPVRIKDNRIKTFIPGPLVSGMMSRNEVTSDMVISILSGESSIVMDIAGKQIALGKGSWSDWVDVNFRVDPLKKITGIVKFYLKDVRPEFELFMTTVQINPRDPAFVISNPDEYVSELADELGDFYTLGIPEDTKALQEGRIDEEAFITMCDEIINEQEKMLRYELNRFNDGLLAFVFCSTDRIQHMFWAATDTNHPLYNKGYEARYGQVINDYYRRMDKILGEVLRYADDRTAVMVLSDHGFAGFRREVHLNSWLVANGFMTLKNRAGTNSGDILFQDVDWKRTFAYALGFGSIYLNINGRERDGIIDKDNTDSLIKDLSGKLSKMTDPKDSLSVVRNVYKGNTIYSGNESAKSPDIIVGFQEGYRASWQTSIGGAPSAIFEDNIQKWSGDHIMDPSIVPGILLTNFRVNTKQPGVADIAPTVLSCFGMSDSSMEGKTLI